MIVEWLDAWMAFGNTLACVVILNSRMGRFALDSVWFKSHGCVLLSSFNRVLIALSADNRSLCYSIGV